MKFFKNKGKIQNPEIFLHIKFKMATKNGVKIAGFISCGAYKQAKNALCGLTAIFPEYFSVSLEECIFFHLLTYILNKLKFYTYIF